jgi:hypothetical protein
MWHSLSPTRDPCQHGPSVREDPLAHCSSSAWCVSENGAARDPGSTAGGSWWPTVAVLGQTEPTEPGNAGQDRAGQGSSSHPQSLRLLAMCGRERCPFPLTFHVCPTPSRLRRSAARPPSRRISTSRPRLRKRLFTQCAHPFPLADAQPGMYYARYTTVAQNYPPSRFPARPPPPRFLQSPAARYLRSFLAVLAV